LRRTKFYPVWSGSAVRLRASRVCVCVYIKGVILMKAYGVIEFSSGAHARDNFVLSPMYLHLKIPFPRLFYAHHRRYFSSSLFSAVAEETHKGVCDDLGKCESDFMTFPLSYNALSRRKETFFWKPSCLRIAHVVKSYGGWNLPA